MQWAVLQTSPHPSTTQDMLYHPAKPILCMSSSNSGCCRACFQSAPSPRSHLFACWVAENLNNRQRPPFFGGKGLLISGECRHIDTVGCANYMAGMLCEEQV